MCALAVPLDMRSSAFSSYMPCSCGAAGRNSGKRVCQFSSKDRMAVSGALRVFSWLPPFMCCTRRSRASEDSTHVMRRGWELKAVGPILVSS